MNKQKVPKLRFPGFTGEWVDKRLGDVAEIIDGDRGLNYPKQEDFSSNGYCLFLNAKNVTKGGFIFNETQFISESKDNQLRKGKLVKGDIVLTTRGTVGNFAHYVNTVQYCNVRLNSGMVILRNMTNNSTEFYYKYFYTDIFNAQIKKILFGSAQPQLTIGEIKKFKIAQPTLPEQNKIANFLADIDTKIEKLARKKELTEQYKKGAMQKIFSQKIRFKDESGKNYPDWEENRLAEVCECLDNKRVPLNEKERNSMQGEIPYYGANGIVDYVSDFIFNEPLILLAEDGGNFDEYRDKPIAQFIKGKSWINNHAHVLRANKLSLINFMFYSLVHKDIRKYIAGSSRAKLNKSDMLLIQLDLPCLQEQKKIADFLVDLDTIIEHIDKELAMLKEFKKGLLQGMFV